MNIIENSKQHLGAALGSGNFMQLYQGENQGIDWGTEQPWKIVEGHVKATYGLFC